MRYPDNTRDAELFDEIYSDRKRAAKAMRYTVYVDDEPVRVLSARAFSASDAPAVALDATLPWPLHYTKERKSVRVELSIEGRPWIDYEGILQTLGEDEGGGGSFGASTAGYYQGGEDSIKFNKETSYAMAPNRAIHDMLSRFPYNRIKNNSSITQPDFIRTGPDAYPLMAPVGEAIANVEEEAGVIQKDSFLNEANVFASPSIGGIVAGDDSVTWRVGEEIESFSADLANSARFFDVGVTRQEAATGDYISLVTPRPRVRYPAGVEPPPENTTWWEEISEETDATVDARSLAFSISAALSFGGEYTVSFTTPFIDPRIEDYDVRNVIRHNYETNMTTFYKVLIESQARDYTAGKATYTGMGVILERVEGAVESRPAIPSYASIGTTRPVDIGSFSPESYPGEDVYPGSDFYPGEES